MRHHRPRRTRVKGVRPEADVASPNGTSATSLGGVIFREPIILQERAAAGGRLDQADHQSASHAYGEQYRATDSVSRKGTLV